jgi:hypothetical protein
VDEDDDRPLAGLAIGHAVAVERDVLEIEVGKFLETVRAA